MWWQKGAVPHFRGVFLSACSLHNQTFIPHYVAKCQYVSINDLSLTVCEQKRKTLLLCCTIVFHNTYLSCYGRKTPRTSTLRLAKSAGKNPGETDLHRWLAQFYQLSQWSVTVSQHVQYQDPGTSSTKMQIIFNFHNCTFYFLSKCQKLWGRLFVRLGSLSLRHGSLGHSEPTSGAGVNVVSDTRASCKWT